MYLEDYTLHMRNYFTTAASERRDENESVEEKEIKLSFFCSKS
jgi:hypothetical protein